MNIVDVFKSKYNLIAGLFAALIGNALGEFYFFFSAFFILNIIDYFTGWVKARHLKTESSAIGAIGIFKKVGYWLIIGLSFFISESIQKIGLDIEINLSFLNLLGYFTLATYIINEIRSIAENLIVMKVKVPPYFIKALSFLSKGLAVTEKILTDKNLKGKEDDYE